MLFFTGDAQRARYVVFSKVNCRPADWHIAQLRGPVRHMVPVALTQGRRFNGKTLQCRSIHVCAEPYGDIFNDATRNGVNLRAYSSTGIEHLRCSS